MASLEDSLVVGVSLDPLGKADVTLSVEAIAAIVLVGHVTPPTQRELPIYSRSPSCCRPGSAINHRYASWHGLSLMQVIHSLKARESSLRTKPAKPEQRWAHKNDEVIARMRNRIQRAQKVIEMAHDPEMIAMLERMIEEAEADIRILEAEGRPAIPLKREQ